jgi:hypothetical protein
VERTVGSRSHIEASIAQAIELPVATCIVAAEFPRNIKNERLDVQRKVDAEKRSGMVDALLVA